jgi:hypothetical protein
MLERREITREKEMNKLRGEVDRLFDKLIEAGQKQPTGHGDGPARKD